MDKNWRYADKRPGLQYKVKDLKASYTEKITKVVALNLFETQHTT